METTLEHQSERSKVSIEMIGIKAGLIIWVALLIYFVVMLSSNLLQSEIAWIMNILILGAGLMLMYRYYRSRTQLTVDYLPGLTLGIVTTIISVFLYAITVLIWLDVLDPGRIDILKKNILFLGGDQVTAFKAFISILIEGICSGILISYMLMQYYKSGFKRKQGEKLLEG